MTVHVKPRVNTTQGEQILVANDQFEKKAWGEQQGVDGSIQEQTLKYGISDSKLRKVFERV